MPFLVLGVIPYSIVLVTGIEWLFLFGTALVKTWIVFQN